MQICKELCKSVAHSRASHPCGEEDHSSTTLHICVFQKSFVATPRAKKGLLMTLVLTLVVTVGLVVTTAVTVGPLLFSFVKKMR